MLVPNKNILIRFVHFCQNTWQQQKLHCSSVLVFGLSLHIVHMQVHWPTASTSHKKAFQAKSELTGYIILPVSHSVSVNLWEGRAGPLKEFGGACKTIPDFHVKRKQTKCMQPKREAKGSHVNRVFHLVLWWHKAILYRQIFRLRKKWKPLKNR